MMTSMAYPNMSDMDFLDSVSLDNDLQKEMEKILQGSDKFAFDNYLSSGNENSNHGFNFDTNSTIDEWIQNFQCEDVSKLNQNLLDNSFEIENNNPNLLVNPQNVLQQTFVRPFKKVSQENVTVKVETTEDDVIVRQISNNQFQQPAQTDNVRSFVKIQPSVSQHNYTLTHSNVNINNNTITHVQNFKQQESSPSQRSPVLVKHLHNGISANQPSNFSYSSSNSSQNVPSVPKSCESSEKVYPKPVYSYSCLISMALKNSRNGSLPVSEIYNFMISHFPYFKTAPDGWKNSVRHNLSLNKCFAKVDTPKLNGNAKKGCLWALNPEKIEKMEEEIAKHRKKDLEAIKISMAMPEKLELIEAGKAGPVGGDDPPSPRCSTPHTPHETTKTEYMVNDINVVDGNIQMDQPLPDMNLQNGLWDDLSGEINVVDLPMTTPSITPSHVTLSASTATIPVTISLANGAIYQGNFSCTPTPVTSQDSSQNNQIPSYVLSAQI